MDSKIFWQLNEAYQLGVCNQEVVEEETLSEDELVDIQEWVEALIQEGYNLDDYTDDELYEAYLEDLDEANKLETHRNATKRQKIGRRQDRDFKGILHPADWESQGEPVRQKEHEKRRGNKKRGSEVREQVDLYDVISEYLVSEGFCDSYEDVTVIMANMSEEWREEILEKADNTIRLVYGKGGKGVPIKDGSGNVLRKPNIGFDKQGDSFRQATQDAANKFASNARRREGKNEANAARYDQALKRGIERATNRSDRNDILDPQVTYANRNARSRRASGR